VNKKRQQTKISMVDSPESKVRYNPGNLGDLLKHGWLVEIVRFLHRHKGGETLHYADTFCGFAEYHVDDEAAQRIRDRFHVLTFRRLQEPFLDRGKYAGSVTLARLAAEGYLRASIFDSNPEALASFPSGEAEILEFRSGCDILDSKEPYDLIFLDPYDDIWADCQTVLEKSAARHRLSSVLIFLPFKTEAQGELLTTAVDRIGINCQRGFVKNPGCHLDGTCHFAVIFIPGSSLNLGAVLGLFGELNIVTARVNALASNP
jgi:23S rRNA A2030 N6-methylase RlmJ